MEDIFYMYYSWSLKWSYKTQKAALIPKLLLKALDIMLSLTQNLIFK